MNTLEKKNRSITSIKYIMTLGLITRMLLHLKAILINETFPANTEAYDLIFVNVMLVAGILGDAFTYSLVPILRNIQNKYDNEHVFDYMSNMINMVTLVLSAIAIIAYLIFSKVYRVNNRLLLFGLPILIFVGIRSVLISFLIMRHGFVAGSRGGIGRALVYTLYLYFFGNRFGLEGLMVTGSLATIAQIIIAHGIITNSNDFVYKFKLDFNQEFLFKSFKHLIIIIPMLFIYDTISFSKYSNTFMSYFNGWFLAAVVAVMFPVLVEEYTELSMSNNKSYDGFNRAFTQIISFLIKTLIPVMIILFVNSSMIKDLFLEGGEGLPNLLLHFGIGIVGLAIIPMNIRALMAQYDYIGVAITIATMYIANTLVPNLSSPLLVNYGQDIIIVIGLVMSLLLVNRKTKFLGKNYFTENISLQLKSGAVMLGVTVLLNGAYTFFLKDFITDPLLPLILIGFIGTYIYWKTFEQKPLYDSVMSESSEA